MRPLSVLVLAALALLLASCGGGDGKSDADQIRQTVSVYTKAIYGKNPTKLCDVLVTRKIVKASDDEREKELDGCRKRIKGQDFSRAPKPQKVEVNDIKVDGDKATAQIAAGTGKQRQKTRVSFRRIDDSWRILTGT